MASHRCANFCFRTVAWRSGSWNAMPGKARVPLLAPPLSPSLCNLCPAHGGLSRKAVRPPSLAEWTSERNPVWKFQPNFLTNKAGAQNYFQTPLYLCFLLLFRYPRGAQPQSACGKWQHGPILRTSGAATCTVRPSNASARAFCPFHACASFVLRLKEVVVDHAFFDALCREPAVAPEVKSLIGTLSSNPKLLTAVIEAGCHCAMHARMHVWPILYSVI